MNTSSERIGDEKDQEFSAIGFRVGAEEYGLPLTAVQEIITLPAITRVPKADPYIRGVVNLHGNVIPILDVARRFCIGETAVSETSHVVVVETEDETVGLLAEHVSKVARFNEEDIQPSPPLVSGIAAEFLNGVVRREGRFLIFLNLDKMLQDERGGTKGAINLTQ